MRRVNYHYLVTQTLLWLSLLTQGDQEFWAVDLNLHYNDSTSMNSLVDFMTNGTFNSVDHVYTIPPMTVEKKRQRRRRNQTTDDEVSYVMRDESQ